MQPPEGFCFFEEAQFPNKTKVSKKPSSQIYPDRVRPFHASIVFCQHFSTFPNSPKIFHQWFPQPFPYPYITHEFCVSLTHPHQSLTLKSIWAMSYIPRRLLLWSLEQAYEYRQHPSLIFNTSIWLHIGWNRWARGRTKVRGVRCEICGVRCEVLSVRGEMWDVMCDGSEVCCVKRQVSKHRFQVPGFMSQFPGPCFHVPSSRFQKPKNQVPGTEYIHMYVL